MKLAGITQKEMNEAKAKGMSAMKGTMAMAFVQQLVMAFVLAHFANVWGVADVMGALTLAFWVWLGFIVTVVLNNVLWEKKSVHLYLFNIAYYLVIVAVMALIVGLWK